jgi:hypothetical protein
MLAGLPNCKFLASDKRLSDLFIARWLLTPHRRLFFTSSLSFFICPP